MQSAAQPLGRKPYGTCVTMSRGSGMLSCFSFRKGGPDEYVTFPSRLGSLLSGSSRSVVDEDKPWNDDRAFIPCGLGHVVFEGLNCFAALVCTGLLGWLVITQILGACPGFLGSFEFKVDKEGTPLGPFEC